jgi:protein gp37
MAKRLQLMGQPNYSNGFEVTLHPHVLSHPLKLKKPQIIFVNSMSDLFHKEVPLEFIRQIFDVMKKAQQHTFQVLTKRAERLAELAPLLDWPDNVWMGVTVENADCDYRIDCLRNVPSAIRFLSMEPLLSAIENMNLDNIDWVIVGGESGPGSRPIQKKWVRDIRKQCRNAKIPFFFKQWGGTNKKKTGRLLDNRIYDEMPSLNHQLLATQ